MESEYTALSMALRAAIPLLDVTTSINNGLNFTSNKLARFRFHGKPPAGLLRAIFRNIVSAKFYGANPFEM
jgi:hypothetical protein